MEIDNILEILFDGTKEEIEKVLKEQKISYSFADDLKSYTVKNNNTLEVVRGFRFENKKLCQIINYLMFVSSNKTFYQVSYMFKDDYIEKLIERTIECPQNMDNEEIIKLYNEVQNVFKSFKYSKEEKEKLKIKGQLESLAMIYDGIIVFTKK